MNTNEKKTIKTLTLSAILIAIGFILHAVVPPIFFGVKPDFLLACMFLAIFASTDIKNLSAVIIASGLISALTTGFPGGQLPNIIDKLITGIVFFAMIKYFVKSSSLPQHITFPIAVFIGTFISGFVFLTSASLIVGLPASFTSLFVTVVVPAAVANAFVGFVMFSVLKKVTKND